jgi:hypothetical protein
MRLVALFVALIFLSGARVARAEERKLEIEAEILGAAGKSVGKVKVVAAARSQAMAKGAFGSLSVVLEVDVGPTFSTDCNLTTVRVVQHDEAATDGKKETKTTIQACGVATRPVDLPGRGAGRVVVTVRPAAS